jgi:hypothetical protein
MLSLEPAAMVTMAAAGRPTPSRLTANRPPA